jgi:Flp pilus assembly protein TadD
VGTETELLSLIDRIYAASLDESRWHSTLGEMAILFGGNSANFELIDKRTQRPLYMDHSQEISEENANAYMNHFAALNPRIEPLLNHRAGTIDSDYSLFDEATIGRDEFYNDFLAPHDLRYFVSGMVMNTANSFGMFAIQRSQAQGHIDEDGITLMQRLLPHMQQALDIRLRLAKSDRQNLAYLDGLSIPAGAAQAAQLAQAPGGKSFVAGMAAMRGRKYADALGHFQRSTQSTPRDSRPWMMQGMALNRLGRFTEALAALDKSAALGMTAPRLDFETGWAAIYTGSPQRAVDRLKAYEKSKPGGAKTSEFLGRAYLALGKLDDADKSLREALRRDPGLLPTVKLYLSQIAEARGDTSKAVAEIFDILKQSPESPISQSIRNNVLRPLAVERLNRKRQDKNRNANLDAKPWTALVSTSVGYNNNVTAYSSDLALPAEISNRGSGFLSVEGAAQYVHRIGEDHAVTGGYGVRYDTYFDIGNQEVLDNNLSAKYEFAARALPGDVVVGLTGSFGYTEVGGSRFGDSVGIRPGVSFSPLENVSAEIFYSRTESDIRDSPTGNPAVTNRDATLTAFGMNASLDIPDTGLTLFAGAVRLNNKADGTDHAYQADQFTAGARLVLGGNFAVSGQLTKTQYNYTQPHSLAPNTATGAGFNFERNESTTSANFRLSRALTEKISLFVKFDHTRAESNLQFFSYTQQVFAGGVTARF